MSLDLGARRGPGTHHPRTQGDDCTAMNEEKFGILTKNTSPFAMPSNLQLSLTQVRKPHTTLLRKFKSCISGETHLARELEDSILSRCQFPSVDLHI